MMHEYDDLQRCSRQCASTERALAPGEPYFSALFSEEGALVRRDFAADAWSGPPEQALAWWKSELPPASESTTRPAASDDDLWEILRQLGERNGVEQQRFVLALLLLRRRAVKLAEERAGEPTVWVLARDNDDRTIEVVVCEPSPEVCERIERDLKAWMYGDSSPQAPSQATPLP